MAKNFSLYFGSMTALVLTLFVAGTLGFTVLASAQMPTQNGPVIIPAPSGPFPFGPPVSKASNFTFGSIASIQNSPVGEPEWLVGGHWRTNLLSLNQSQTASGSASNNIGINNSTDSGSVFNANLRMIMLNGSAAHTHVITNFKLLNTSSGTDGTTTFYGNSTISLREGPVVDVPTTIKVSGELISISPDASKVKNHFGNTPIYGVVESGHGRLSSGPIHEGDNATSGFGENYHMLPTLH